VWWDGVVYATTADRWAEAKRPDGGEGDGVFAARRHALADGQVLTIRRPVEADAGALLTYLDGMRRESWGVLSSPEDELFTLAEERAWVRSAREAPDGLQLAAFTQDGEVVAMVGMSTDRRHVRRRHAGVLGLSVRRSHWRRGLGRLLMREVVAYAERRPGLAVLELDVDTFNAPAIALYESLGFERDGVRRNFVRYADGSYGDAMVMSKWVGEGARPTGRDHDPLLGESSA
jgi:RimJ/RimL family protein N-acetyltransferase